MPKYYINNFRFDFIFQLFLVLLQNKLNIYLLPRKCVLQNNEFANIFLYYYTIRKKKFFFKSLFRKVRLRYFLKYRQLKWNRKVTFFTFMYTKRQKIFFFYKKYIKIRLIFTFWKNYLFFKLKMQNKKYQKFYKHGFRPILRYFYAISALKVLKKQKFLLYLLTHILFLALKKKLSLKLLHTNTILYGNKTLQVEGYTVYKRLKKNPRYRTPLLKHSVHIFNYTFTFFQPKLIGYFILRLLSRTRKHTNLFLKIFRNILVFKQVKNFFYGFRLLMRGTHDRHGRTRTFFLQDGVFLSSGLRNPLYYFSAPCVTKFGVFNLRLWLKPYSSDYYKLTYVDRYIPIDSSKILYTTEENK
jgi:hypothetical protein